MMKGPGIIKKVENVKKREKLSLKKRKIDIQAFDSRYPFLIFAIPKNQRIMENAANDYLRRESECEMRFMKGGPFWHLCTPGANQEIIFKSGEDYKFGVTSSATALMEARDSGRKVKIFAFAIMSNHIHELLCGSREDCLEYFRIRKAKLKRHFFGKADFSGFECELLSIENLNAFRYVAAYIHRNGFVHNRKETPYSYEWSSGRFYFNPAQREIPVQPVSGMSYRTKRAILKSAILDSFDRLEIIKGYVSPLSFCEIDEGESFYRDTHQYFHMISRSVESYGIIAKTLGDKIFLNDDELYGIVYRKSKEQFGVKSPRELAPEARVEMARLMHNEYNASNAQIQRMLGLKGHIVDSLFPKAK